MSLILVGLSHHRTPLALREQFSVPSRELPEALTQLRRMVDVEQAVILSTCNRLELYVSALEPATTYEGLVDFLSSRSRLAPRVFEAFLYRLQGCEAVDHLFRVAAGLDAVLLGESEITAQVKEAYRIAHMQGATSTVLNHVFQKALHAAKELRARTDIARGQLSIGSVVLELATQRLGQQLQRAEVLLWGAGKAAEVTARHLIKRGIGQLWIVNRTQFKAQDLASLCQSGWLSWEQARKHLAHVDIAIVCTQAPHYVIDLDDTRAAMAQRPTQPLCLIDLAVPRNIDPAVCAVAGVSLHNIDDLESVVRQRLSRRQHELQRCEPLLTDQVRHCWKRWEHIPQQEAGSWQPNAALSSV